ncbi:MAG: hypothetical protein H7315_10955 [Herminiimonas sp.]|nr:hypothetical protein [Herminiimonas sp.]
MPLSREAEFWQDCSEIICRHDSRHCKIDLIQVPAIDRVKHVLRWRGQSITFIVKTPTTEFSHARPLARMPFALCGSFHFSFPAVAIDLASYRAGIHERNKKIGCDEPPDRFHYRWMIDASVFATRGFSS